ncbi:hypothetical protein AVEN_194457-1 [Araneus ventricosus]|uniref:Uncharacterized protein n=1 Tax=Araneus ventricosus TaxID=182803 RepID=A0A4Y2A5Z6_ARAVE|nr:hypothetical protein AVEN_194457-1 [Araneus ventricosus]
MTSLLQVRRVVTSKLALTCCKLVSHLHSCRVNLAASLQICSASLLQTKIAIWGHPRPPRDSFSDSYSPYSRAGVDFDPALSYVHISILYVYVVVVNETRNNNDINIPEPLERLVVNENRVIKLPLLNISILSGNCSEWLNFWNSFEVAIHKNDSLSKIEKVAYLKTYLRGTALAAVSGFALTEQNYDSSIALIKERFDRSDLVISCHMNKLLMIESVKSVSNVTALRKMYDELEIQVRSLESLGVAVDTYSSFLCPIVLQKFPEEINLQNNRQRKLNELFDIKDLVKFLRKEIECRETSLLLGNQKNYVLEASARKPLKSSNYAETKLSYSPKRNVPAAAALIASTERQNCFSAKLFFCKTVFLQNCFVLRHIKIMNVCLAQAK